MFNRISNKSIIEKALPGSHFTGQLLVSLKYSISGHGTGVFSGFSAPYLEQFQSGFKPGYVTETALVTSVDD